MSITCMVRSTSACRCCALPTWHTMPDTVSPLPRSSASVSSTFCCRLQKHSKCMPRHEGKQVRRRVHCRRTGTMPSCLIVSMDSMLLHCIWLEQAGLQEMRMHMDFCFVFELHGSCWWCNTTYGVTCKLGAVAGCVLCHSHPSNCLLRSLIQSAAAGVLQTI